MKYKVNSDEVELEVDTDDELVEVNEIDAVADDEASLKWWKLNIGDFGAFWLVPTGVWAPFSFCASSKGEEALSAN